MVFFLQILLFFGSIRCLYGNDFLDKKEYTKFQIKGQIAYSEKYSEPFGPGFLFELNSIDHGWYISIKDERKTEDISRFTTPWYGPNPRYIEGWHFRNSDNTGPNELGEKNVNAPGILRKRIIFSPEVGRSIGGPTAIAKPTLQELQRIASFGRVKLKILNYKLGNLVPNKGARIELMKFSVDISWPMQYQVPPENRKKSEQKIRSNLLFKSRDLKLFLLPSML